MRIKISNLDLKEKINKYSTYFISIIICSALFFSFLSISDSKSAIMANNIYDFSYFKSIIIWLIYISSFGIFLILNFVNNNIYKIRIKNISILNILGAKRSSLAKILSMELFPVYFIGVLLGICIGEITSQLVNAFITFSILGKSYININLYINTLTRTFIYFALIFILTNFLNSFSIMRKKPIELINDGKNVNKKSISKTKLIILSIVFIFSFLYISYNTYAYFNLGRDFNGPIPHYESNKVQASLLIASILLIYSFFYTVVYFISRKRNKQSIYKNDRLFIFSNIQMNIFENVKLLVGLVLFLVISILGFSLPRIFSTLGEENYHNRMKNDIYVITDFHVLENQNDTVGVDYSFMGDLLEDKGVKLKNGIELRYYYPRKDDFKPYSKKNNRYDNPRLAISLSQYNELRKMQNLEEIDLDENEFAFQLPNTIDWDQYKENLINDRYINLDSLKLEGKGKGLDHVYTDNLGPYTYGSTNDLLIFPDKVTDKLDLANINFIGDIEGRLNYKDAKKLDEEIKTKVNKQFESLENKYKKQLDKEKSDGFLSVIRIDDIEKVDVKFMSLLTLILGTYIGFIFIIISLTLLLIQSMINTKNYLNNYKMLEILGLEKSRIEKINKKITYGFSLIPLLVAIIVTIAILISIFIRYKQRIKLFIGLDIYVYSLMISLVTVILLIILYIFIIARENEKLVNQTL